VRVLFEIREAKKFPSKNELSRDEQFQCQQIPQVAQRV